MTKNNAPICLTLLVYSVVSSSQFRTSTSYFKILFSGVYLYTSANHVNTKLLSIQILEIIYKFVSYKVVAKALDTPLIPANINLYEMFEKHCINIKPFKVLQCVFCSKLENGNTNLYDFNFRQNYMKLLKPLSVLNVTMDCSIRTPNVAMHYSVLSCITSKFPRGCSF